MICLAPSQKILHVMLYTLLHPIRLIPTFLLFQVEDRALEDSVRILTKFEDMANSFSLDNVFRYIVTSIYSRFLFLFV